MSQASRYAGFMTDPHMRLVGPLADREAWTADHCSLDGAFTVIGTRSAMLILREAYYGTTRFDGFVTGTGMTEAVTAGRLKDLVAYGLLERRPYQEPGRRTRHEYVLTESGIDLLPAIVGLFHWGDKHIAPASGGPRLALSHRDCGRLVTAHVRCDAGHEVQIDDIDVRTRGKASALQ